MFYRIFIITQLYKDTFILINWHLNLSVFSVLFLNVWVRSQSLFVFFLFYFVYIPEFFFLPQVALMREKFSLVRGSEVKAK